MSLKCTSGIRPASLYRRRPAGCSAGVPPASAILLALVFTLFGVRAADDFTFADDFSKYPAGTDATPAWSSGGIAWEVRNGAFVCTEGAKDQALAAGVPVGGRVAAQVDLKLRETTSKGWKVAGLCVVKDPANFWHLALAEAPDKDGKRHFVELTEMHQGAWLAQTQAATKLQQKNSQGQGFNWEYNHAYRLTLELTPEGIRGQVLETDGTVRAAIAYGFAQNPAVTCGQPGLTSGGFRAEFSAFSTKVSEPVKVEKAAATWPAYESHGNTAIKSKATGFFRVEQIDGRWWTIDPAGNAFFIIGTDHANYRVHWCEKLGYAPYNRNCEKKYGGEAKWADSTVARLKAWGFNALGVNAAPSIQRRGLPHPEFLSLGTGFTAHDYITERTTWTGFPNVFSPKWQAYCEKRAQALCAPHKDDPWVLGYFIDNELEWHAWTGKGLFGDTFAKPADHSAKRALVELLKQRHPTPADFNKAWGTTIASLDELLALKAAPSAGSDAAKADVAEYTRLVAERYFSIASAAIRKYDPNHMVLGCRFAGYAPEIVDVAGKYCDIFSINCYRNVDLERGVMSDKFEEDLRRWHEQSKRPMMITEWSFPALDAGLPCKHGAGQRVPTQADKAFCYTVFQKLLFSTPFMVGSNYFMWADEPALGISSTFPEDSNYGLVNENDDVYELVTKAATKLHPLAYDIHGGKMTDVFVKAGERGNGFTVGNTGAVATKAKLTLWVNGQAQSRDVELAPGTSQNVAPPVDVAAKPGGHLLACEVAPASSLLEKNPADNSAAQSAYVSGAPWLGDIVPALRARVPLVVANPSARAADQTILAVKLAAVLQGQVPAAAELNRHAIYDEKGQRVIDQVDGLEGGDELAFVVESLPAYTPRTYHFYMDAGPIKPNGTRVKYTKTDAGFEVDNGVLKLVKDNPKSGNAFDRIALRGLELGRFTPLLHQVAGQNAWVGPDLVEKVEVCNGFVRLVLDLTFARTAERKFRTKYRFVIEPDREWFTSQLIWVENTDAQAWDLPEYYHYLPSSIGGDAQDDEARGNYWFDAKTKTCFGIVPGAPGIGVQFWKDPGGGEHPDASRKLNITLRPGERYAKPEPVAFIVASKEEAWNATTLRLRNQRGLIWQAFPPEKK